jgi:hypothetical protein
MMNGSPSFDLQERQRVLSHSSVEARTSFLSQVYGWMCAGLVVTALTAWGMIQNPDLMNQLVGGQGRFLLLIGLQLGAVIVLAAAFQRLSFEAAAGIFLLYSALTGVTFSTLFLVYTGASIASVFFITAGTFGAVSFYGMTTKRDLSNWGSFLFMGLIGIIVASVVNFFLHSDNLTMAISYLAVLIFTGLTAYDTQRLLRVHESGRAHGRAGSKLAVYGALQLYLDFINLFLALLRIMGRRR